MGDLSFSQRIGIEPAEKPFLRESVSDVVRTRVWNVLYLSSFSRPTNNRRASNDSKLLDFLRILWHQHLNLAVDEIPVSYQSALEIVKKHMHEAGWGEFFDFVEFCCKHELLLKRDTRLKKLEVGLNEVLQAENSAYRIINGLVTEVTSEAEIAAIEQAVQDNPYENCKTHLRKAHEFLSDKENPDYRNSIKESISAVEGIARTITGKDSLRKALAHFEKEKNLHTRHKDAFVALYNWTSDDGGARHALMNKETLTFEDARFMLVVCSAFVNYLIDLNRQ